MSVGRTRGYQGEKLPGRPGKKYRRPGNCDPVDLLRCNQRESLPPPDDLAVFLRDAEKRPGGIRRARDHFKDLDSVFVRGRGGFKIPVQIRLFEWNQI